MVQVEGSHLYIRFDMIMLVVSATTNNESSLDFKIDKIKSEWRNEQVVNVEQMAKKAQLEKPHVFKSRGNTIIS